MYLRSALGGDMVVVGTSFGHGEGFPAKSAPLAPDAPGMDGLLSSLSIPVFIMDLRELPAGILHEWFQTAHVTRVGGHDPGVMVAPVSAYDAILFIETITPIIRIMTPTPVVPKQ
jgi:hypothetical protein